ncbi:helix-turn-helix domain-containing protein [Pseudanabaena sp. FACHB-1277]|jgi:hypothetical protein|uniref:Helix-turn-helix domain-containing protein n=1 Tax=Pseudanabaena cinerea FACHB-1277 TaxID=2949581 RepID=A0A926Z8I5_9CYAN|nr:helix-turn-helix domain-containing protein [Pseudanabaena cinerea]MBD2152748.1 helix-turn-helix domain-containing protein [Pseudanabaena cinerea FACHB-1277]
MERLKITLTASDYHRCVTLCMKGSSHASTIHRAQVLLALHDGVDISEVMRVLRVKRTRLWRLRKQYLQSGLNDALADRRRRS